MKSKLTAAILFGVFSPTLVFGLGIRIPDQDPAATARGEAFVATADNLSAIYYNPAGITQIDGLSARFGTYTLGLQDRYTPRTGNGFETKDKIQAVPQAYVVYSPKNSPLSFGLGEYSPFGLAIEYPDNASFRTLARKASVKFLTTNP